MGHKVDNRAQQAYNRYQYISEKRDVLQRWADWVEELVGEPTEVVTIGKG